MSFSSSLHLPRFSWARLRIAPSSAATGPGRGRPRVSAYRIVMMVVLALVVAAVGWSDLHLSEARMRAVGSAAVACWLLTLLGAQGIGPMGALREALRR